MRHPNSEWAKLLGERFLSDRNFRSLISADLPQVDKPTSVTLRSPHKGPLVGRVESTVRCSCQLRGTRGEVQMWAREIDRRAKDATKNKPPLAPHYPFPGLPSDSLNYGVQHVGRDTARDCSTRREITENTGYRCNWICRITFDPNINRSWVRHAESSCPKN
jgi:hypothetical protein